MHLKSIILSILLLTITYYSYSQAITGLEVHQEHNVLFGESLSGAGTKLMWIPEKAAFRAGAIVDSLDSWDINSIGDHSIAFGQDNRASGFVSTAWGYSNTASGDYSTTWGYENIAQSVLETVIGQFADTLTYSNPTTWDPDDQLFVVGNGSSDSTRNNAFTILKSGETFIDGPLSIAEPLEYYHAVTKNYVDDRLGVCSSTIIPELIAENKRLKSQLDNITQKLKKLELLEQKLDELISDQ